MSADWLAASTAPLPNPQRPARPEPSLRPLDRPASVRRPRMVYGVVAVAGALTIAAAQMGLSILTTQTSYELADLTSQQRELGWEKQMLQDEIAGLGSPQYLAANASALGMVVGQAPNYLRLSDSALIGTSVPANGTSALSALGKAAVGNALVAGVPLVTDPAASLAAGATVDPGFLVDPATPPAIADGLPTPATH